MSIFKKFYFLLIAMVVCCCNIVKAQPTPACTVCPSQTCTGKTAGTLGAFPNSGIVCPGSNANIQQGTLGSGLPQAEYAILDNSTLVGTYDPDPAVNTQGPKIVGFTSTLSFNPASYGFAAGDEVCVVRVNYDVVEIQQILNAIKTQSVLILGSCCSIVQNFGGLDICACITLPTNTNYVNLQDLLDMIACVNGGTADISPEGVKYIVAQLAQLPGGCRANKSGCIAYSNSTCFTYAASCCPTLTSATPNPSSVCSGSTFAVNVAHSTNPGAIQLVYSTSTLTATAAYGGSGTALGSPITPGSTATTTNFTGLSLPANTTCSAITYNVYAKLATGNTNISTNCQPLTPVATVKVYPNLTLTVDQQGGCTASVTVSPAGCSNIQVSYTDGLVNGTGTSYTASTGEAGVMVFSAVNTAAGVPSACAAATDLDVSYDCTTSCTPPDITATPTNNTSCGTPNGAADLTLTGGTSPFTFAWSNQATTQNLTGLGAGTYTVTVTATGDCTATATVLIATVTSTPTGTTSTTANTSCGTPNGAVTLTVSGGLTYLWSNQATTQNLTGVASGTYTVTITGAGGCTSTASGSVANNTAAPTGTTSTTANTSCGTPNGAVTLTVSGGTATGYAWSNSATTQNLTGVASGTYTVTITGAGGCTSTASGSVANNTAAPTGTTSTTANTSCSTPNGAVTLTVSGGTATGYAWSNSATTQNLTDVASGTYTVTITGAGGCTSTASGSVANNTTAPTGTTSTTANTSCGTPNGAVNLTVSGGTATGYAWSNSATTQNLTGVSSGTYTVTITGAGGCTSTASGSVANSAGAPNLSTGVTNNSACTGAGTGAINLTVTGGTSPYTFAWSNSTTTQNQTGLTSGTYSVTVTDNNGCTNTTSASVGTTPNAPNVTANVTNNTACNTPKNGAVTLTVSGGQSPYTYNWSNGATTQNLSALAAGSYTVTVTGANGCTATRNATVAEAALNCNNCTPPAAPTLSSNGTTTLCFAGTGTPNSVVLTATAAPTGFGYLWSNGATTQGVTLSNAGTYTVKYVKIGDATCTSPNSTSATIVVNDCTPQTACLCSIAPTAINCVPPAPSLTHDAAKCVFNASNCNPPVITVVSLTQGTAGGISPVNYNTILLNVAGGTTPYTYQWYTKNYAVYGVQAQSNGSVNIQVKVADNATFAVTVTDALGCKAVYNEDINAGISPIANYLDISTFQISGTTGINGAINITVVGCGSGGGGYTYAWSGPNGFTAATEDVTGLASGWYTVTVSCGGQTTEGWYWVPKKRPGRGKGNENYLSAYPNPFENETIIEFTASESGNSVIELYDVEGRKVKELFNSTVNMGDTHKVTLSGDGLTAGVYLVKLLTQEDGQIAYIKLMILK